MILLLQTHNKNGKDNFGQSFSEALEAMNRKVIKWMFIIAVLNVIVLSFIFYLFFKVY